MGGGGGVRAGASSRFNVETKITGEESAGNHGLLMTMFFFNIEGKNVCTQKEKAHATLRVNILMKNYCNGNRRAQPFASTEIYYFTNFNHLWFEN